MADDKDQSQQTEEPTQHKLEQAKEHGDIVSSQEVTTLILLTGGTLAVAIFATSAAHEFLRIFRTFLAEPDQIAVDPGALQLLMGHLLLKLLALVGPFLGLMMLVGVGANLLQHSPSITFDRIKPDLSKLSPMKGFKRLFGFEGLMTIIKGLIKIGVVGIAIWTQLYPERGTLEGMLTQSPVAIATDMTHLFFKVMFATLAAMTVIAGADYMFQRFQFIKRNKMTKQEVKEEFRQTEGDPIVKGRIRQIRMERAKRRMIAEVPKATVVITNPTHYAIALKYESGKTQAPICVAKGVDALALRIRDKAKEHNVPVVENPPLARALYATVEVDEAIPVEHYKAVAQVIGYVMKLAGKLRPN
jgi:flagellar biosynthetic protein FlhB